MSLRLKTLEKFLHVSTEYLPNEANAYPLPRPWLVTITCEKAMCRRCTITFRSDRSRSLPVYIENNVVPFSLLCIAQLKEAVQENHTFGQKKVK